MNKNEYKWYAELIYGNVPEDRNWAEGTGVWKEKFPLLISNNELKFNGTLWKRCLHKS